MKTQYFKIKEIPAVLLGEQSEKLFLFVHGLCGSKEEAKAFAEIACPLGWQVLGIDLPKHGERINSDATLDPWHAAPELLEVMQYAKLKWEQVALRATSIGSYFSLIAFAEGPPVRCLLVSPLLDMVRTIENLMRSSGVSDERLEREKLIETNLGQVLSWEYLCYARSHQINRWSAPTYILRASEDEIIDEDTVTDFSRRFGCKLTIALAGEHWFHTPEQLEVMSRWEADSIKSFFAK